MSRAIACPSRVVLSGILIVLSLFPSAASSQKPPDDPDVGVFMSYLRQNWDDIHDVIMRFHNENPELAGTVVIAMTWREGSLAEASVDSNSSGDPALGRALIEAMKGWHIEGLSDSWAAAIPFRTTIQGSERPEFPRCGIFTGNVVDGSGNPVRGARIVFLPRDRTSAEPDTAYTNREGIFIRTLIPPGAWRLVCEKAGYEPTTVENLTSEAGSHVKTSIVLSR